MNQAVGYGRVTLCVGTGNEGNQAGHAAGRVRQGENYEVELGIGPYEPAMNLQIWKNYQDQNGTFAGASGRNGFRTTGTDFGNTEIAGMLERNF